MSIPLATLFGLGAGAAIAVTARRATVRELDPFRSRYLAIAGLFGTLVLTPAGLALYLLFPDWSLMYFANPAHLGWYLVVPLLVFLYLGGPPIGFLVTRLLLLRSRPRDRRLVLLTWILLLGIVLIGGAARLGRVAYYEAFHTGEVSLTLVRSSLFLPLLAITGATVAVLVFTLMPLRRHMEAAEALPASASGPATNPLRPFG